VDVESRRLAGQVLIFDADDTLWENNILFERVIEEYLTWLDHPTLDRHETRAVLNDIEAANAVTYGYGAKVFLRSLQECFQRLSERPATAEERDTIDGLAAALIDHEVELIPGVADTLAELGRRHSMLLLTKGDPEDQQRKIDASRLGHHFEHVHIVAEKHVGSYTELIERHELAVEKTWMIGNSPKSDIRPARAAGMNAVFIPNQHTWVLEHDELDHSDERILMLRAFPELLRHF
jgi:putative hydrolase of the HAD superfamily